ncbi:MULTISPECIES: Hsp20/alpha crystallin family protein [unclassified Meiothermus]|uniref:Hsp20/alpha crystallin family protein n=1 Tax=unclassified Meiothermus TaxID=370471 RepID=UPI000D7BBCF4|nr:MULTISPECIES: Hsp20/alpha crystallin family protein [unclassified Meiothermus]PZA07162.1 Hsp20/alpha crystallin family protein [Meiothermus sp. Pnk-1]RYM39956.1 Hsp20/alpha crystallin family protein [Meiothermus sp. PNK-Is4]
MLEKIWPFARFGRNKFRQALEEALEKAFEGADFEPSSELVEEEGRYVLRTELPGLDKKDVQVYLEGPFLIIEAERKEEQRKRHLSEIYYGRIYRSIPLPADAQPEGIQARLKRGVLEVEIPRIPSPSPARRSIAIEG